MTTVEDLRQKVSIGHAWHPWSDWRLWFPAGPHATGWIDYKSEVEAARARDRLLSLLAPLGLDDTDEAYRILEDDQRWRGGLLQKRKTDNQSRSPARPSTASRRRGFFVSAY